MKRRVSKLLVVLTAMTLMLSGCSIGGFDIAIGGKEEVPQVEVTPAPVVEAVMEGAIYEMGTVVSAAEIIQTDPAKVPATIAFLKNGTEVADTIECTEAGTFSIDVVVQYEDGTNWGGVFTYTVEGKDLLAAFPEDIAKNILSEGWVQIPILISTTKTVDGSDEVDYIASDKFISYTPNKFDLISSDDYSFNASSSGYEKDEWDFKIYRPQELALMSAYKLNPIKDPIALSIMREMMSMFAPSISAGTEGEVADEDKYLDYTLQLVSECYSVESGSTGKFLYDVDGNAYEIFMSKVIVSDELFGGSTKQINCQAFYIETESGTMLFTLEKDSKYVPEVIVIEPETEEEEEEEEDLGKLFPDGPPATYEEFKTVVLENGYLKDEVEITSSDDTTRMIAALDRLTPYCIIGDVTPLIPAEVEQPTETPTQQPAGTSTQEPTGTSTPEPENELQIDTSITGLTKHSKRFPSLFTAFKSNIGNRYSKWDKIVDSSTQYTGTIFDKNGNVVDLGTKKEYDEDENPTISGWGSEPESPEATPEAAIQSFLMETAKGSFTITNEKDTQHSVITNLSSNSKVVCKVYNEVIYISTASQNAVDSLVKTCAFDKTLFAKDTEQEIWRYDGDVSELGSIDYFKIKYTDVETNKNTTGGYMAVVKISDLNLVVLPDNPVSLEVLEYVCNNMIKRN